MINKLKDIFAWTYQRYQWGYSLFHTPIGLFNTIGILAILLGDKVKSYDLVIYLGIGGIISFVFVGIIFYDKLKIKTNLTKHDGKNNEYWTHRLTPLQQKTQLMLLKSIENPKLVKEYKRQVKEGRLR